jgi:squalene-hopene/tetraprenyl-beta-curcumene cyclase
MTTLLRTRALHLLLLALLSVGCAYSQEQVSVWQGTFKSGPEQHRAVLRVAETSGNQWSAKALYIEFIPYPLQIDSSSLANAHFRLAANGGKGIYEGTLSSDGSTLHGTWTWEQQPVALELHRVAKEAVWPVPFQYQYHYKDVTYARPAPDEAKIPFSPRLAVDYMEQGAVAWTGERQCVACHTNGSYMVVRPLMTQQLGPPQEELRNFFLATLRNALAVDPAKLQTDVEPTQMVYVAAGLAIWDAHVLHHLSPETSQALELMFKLQRPAGDWFIEDDNNPPLESSTYQLATVAARAVANAPGWLDQQRKTPLEDKINLLKRYLREPHKMQGDYDRTDLLWTASEFPGLLDARKTQELIDMVVAHQQLDGGWSIRTFATPEEWGKGNRAAKLRSELDFNFPQSDGHMTGLAIIALRKAGVPESDPHLQAGVKWLLTNQRSSGRWWTRSLNRDGWQFISYSGTAYPLLALALCDALPPKI